MQYGAEFSKTLSAVYCIVINYDLAVSIGIYKSIPKNFTNKFVVDNHHTHITSFDF